MDTIRIPRFNYSDPSSVALGDYRDWFKEHGNFTAGIKDCDMEKEMQTVNLDLKILSFSKTKM